MTQSHVLSVTNPSSQVRPETTSQSETLQTIIFRPAISHNRDNEQVASAAQAVIAYFEHLRSNSGGEHTNCCATTTSRQSRVVDILLFPTRSSGISKFGTAHRQRHRVIADDPQAIGRLVPHTIMSVAYEPRSFIHEGAYPNLGDEHDHTVDQRFTDSEVAEHLSHYTAEASMLPDDRVVLGDERDMLVEDDSVIQDDQLDLGAPVFSSPLQVDLHAPSLTDTLPEHKDLSPGPGSPSSSRVKAIPKPERAVHKKSDGKFHCPLEDCKEEVKAFTRKCEWNKHMDKHERPYRCPAEGCENLPGFTYSGGLLRHEREVHGKHGGPKNTVNCPHPNCKRHTGKGFSRQENLNEHLRRVHTNLEGLTSTPPGEIVAALSPDDNDSEKSGMKRKRRSSGHGFDELSELRDETKRLRDENEKLKTDLDQQSQHALAMMAQIAELQDALRHGLSQHALGAPTAQMI